MATHPTDRTQACRLFDLDPQGVVYPLGASEATHVLTEILHQDLAYGAEIMPWAEAAQLAERFALATRLHEPSTSCYTNFNFTEWQKGFRTWSPATESTFDRGILAVSEVGVGCLWVEDED